MTNPSLDEARVRTILVIEDQDTLRRNVALLLEMEGFRVVTAENGRLGVEMARRERPDLVICDVMMPEMDGHEVLRELRRDGDFDAMPFLFLSARGDRVDVSLAQDLGADGYLTKPVIRKDLLSAVGTGLSAGRSRGTAFAEPKMDGATESGALRDSLSVLLTSTDILRHHGRNGPEAELQAQREAMKEAGERLARAMEKPASERE